MHEYKHERIEKCKTESIKERNNEGTQEWKPEKKEEVTDERF